MPKEEARTLLAQQIAKFVELEERVVQTKDELERYKRDRLRYTKFNTVMNERLFGEDVDKFWRYELASPAYNADFETQLEFYKDQDGKQLTELHAVHDALDMLNGNPVVQRPTPELRKKKWSRTERLMIWGLILSLLAVLCAASVVPEFRNFVYKARVKILGK